jgi:hypothetical protein
MGKPRPPVPLFAIALILVAAHAQRCTAQLSIGREAAESTASHGYVLSTKEVPGAKTPGDYTLVLTRDEIYVPILVRKPQGPGPFPAITMGWGEGRGGMKKIVQLSESLSQCRTGCSPKATWWLR